MNSRLSLYRGKSEAEYDADVDPFYEIEIANNQVILSDELIELLKTPRIDIDELVKMSYCNYEWSENQFEQIAIAGKIEKLVKNMIF